MTLLTLEPAKTALVVIDMTRGVLSMPTVPHPVEEVLANTVRLADAFRNAGGFVVLVNVNSVDGKDMLHPISDTKFSLSAERPKGWAELALELGPQALDHLITKHQWGAFFGTDLDLQLRRRGIDTIILCGIATGFGVDTTARQAYQHGYNQVFAEDAMNALSEEEHHYVCTHIFPAWGVCTLLTRLLQCSRQQNMSLRTTTNSRRKRNGNTGTRQYDFDVVGHYARPDIFSLHVTNTLGLLSYTTMTEMRAESLKRWIVCLVGGMSITWVLRTLWVQYGQHSRAIRLFNRVVLNPIVLAFAGRPGLPYAVLYHVGRHSERFYATPLLVQPTKYGWVIPLTYGELTDWYRNIKQAGECTIQWQGRRYLAEIPERMDATQAFPLFTPAWRLALRFAGIRQFVKLTSA